MNLKKFNIYPAIHLRQGKVVRFSQGDTENPIVFHTDPIACARQWIEQGAEWLQVVNLDAAFDEEASNNWDLIEQITALEVNIQFGGGIRNIDDVHWAIKAGIKRVIIGTAAVENPELMAEAISTYGSKVIVLGIDSDEEGEVKIHGWKDGGSIHSTTLAIQMRQLGVTTAVHTSIHLDGSMTGVDIETSLDLAKISGLRIIVGGGIGNLQDIRECFHHDAIDGVIVGKALYTGNVDLASALHIIDQKDSFEAGLDRWKEDQRKPWNKFSYEMIEHNLKKHLPVDSPPLRILDAGGGNGFDSLSLARMNHHLDIADISQQMLNEARANAALAGVTERVSTHAIDILDIDKKFDENSFDIVLCHNVLQFIDGPAASLKKIHKVLKPGGFLSLVTTNQYSRPFQAAFVDRDIDQAFKVLDKASKQDSVFDIRVHAYRSEQVAEWLAEIGLTVKEHYGIRCFYNYWGDNEEKNNHATYDKLKKLEIELTEREPYKHCARQFQLIAFKD